MRWIALQAWSEEGEPDPALRQALAWQALAYTPRVTLAPDAALMEVAASLRLFGGLRPLLQGLQAATRELLAPGRLHAAPGPTTWVALGRLRLGQPWRVAARVAPHELPLEVLDAAQPHLDVLARLGCRHWGELRQLPREGLARRFGQNLLDALDEALGERPESHRWLQLPEVFEEALELPFVVEHSTGLVFALQRLLQRLKAWLVARNLGVLGVRVVWQMDARRGVDRTGELVLRLGEPTQDVAHIARLAAEHLVRVQLPAPAQALSLRSLETAALSAHSHSLLIEDQRRGESLSQLVERLAARLGSDAVQGWEGRASHVPERMQAWPALAPVGAQPPGRPLADNGRSRAGTNRREGSAPTAQAPNLVGAQPPGRAVANKGPLRAGTNRREGSAPTAQAPNLVGAQPPGRAVADNGRSRAGTNRREGSAPTAQGLASVGAPPSGRPRDDLLPTWLLHEPLRLPVQGERPCYEGPLTLLVGPQRLETSGWHGLQPGQGAQLRASEPPVMRDYFIARSERAGLLWVFRERLPRNQAGGWFLHGLFA